MWLKIDSSKKIKHNIPAGTEYLPMDSVKVVTCFVSWQCMGTELLCAVWLMWDYSISLSLQLYVHSNWANRSHESTGISGLLFLLLMTELLLSNQRMTLSSKISLHYTVFYKWGELTYPLTALFSILENAELIFTFGMLNEEKMIILQLIWISSVKCSLT